MDEDIVDYEDTDCDDNPPGQTEHSHLQRSHAPHSAPTLHTAQNVNGLNDRLTALSRVLRERTLVQLPTTTLTTSNTPLTPSVTGTTNSTPAHPPSHLRQTRSKSLRAKTSSKPSRSSPKSSSATSRNPAKPPRSSNCTTMELASPSSTLPLLLHTRQTASARITRVEHNTIRVDHRIDLLLTGLEDQIAREVDRRVGVAMTTVCEQLKEDLLRNITHSTTDVHAHQPSPPSPSLSSSSSTTRALLPPLTHSLPKRPSYPVTLHATKHMVSGTTHTRSQPLLGEPHSVMVTLSPECPAFSTTIDFLFDMTRDWSSEVERHTNSYARLPIPSRIMRVDSHHLQLTFNAFGIETFLSTWNTFHDAIACLSHLSVSRSI
ncbi:hypothetical protein C8R42DRAFT_682539 [Lentinula raphanica]|nr:hypothetical protein C8R42DRAFT_682539 [Lentinula raphanica]